MRVQKSAKGNDYKALLTQGVDGQLKRPRSIQALRTAHRPLLFAWSWYGWCQPERESEIRLCSWQGELPNANPSLLA